jgi:glutamyl-tRNA reductase
MHIILIGLNHQTAPVALREQLSLASCGVKMALEDLPVCLQPQPGGPGTAGCDRDLIEAVIISTCNRLEVYAVVGCEAVTGWQMVESYLARLQGVPQAELRPHLYFLEGHEAVDHLFRVAAGLDSMILGEPQILGQVTSALSAAQNSKTSGPILSHLFERAVHAGKRARAETEIGRHTTSTSHAAVQLVRDKLGSLDQVHVLVVGAGEMADVAAHALRDQGVRQLTFINRTYARAEELARQFQGRALNWYHLPAALAMADAVVTATGAPHIVIHHDDVAQIMQQRAHRPLLFVDIAVPRDVEEAVGRLPGVFRHDIDDLQTAVDANLAQRQAAVPTVEAIIAEEKARFEEWLQGRQVLPVLVELRRKTRAIADTELERYLPRLEELDPQYQALVARLVHRIVNKVLHEPTVRLKASAADGNGSEYAQAVRELFGLEATPAARVPILNDQGTEGQSVNGHSSNRHSSNAHSSNGQVKNDQMPDDQNHLGIASRPVNAQNPDLTAGSATS